VVRLSGFVIRLRQAQTVSNRPRSPLSTLWLRLSAKQMLREAGFTSIEVYQLEHDFLNDYYVVRR